MTLNDDNPFMNDDNHEPHEKLDAQSMDAIDIASIQYMKANDVKNVDSTYHMWDALTKNDPDRDDAKIALQAKRKHETRSNAKIVRMILICLILLAIIATSIMYMLNHVFIDNITGDDNTQQQTEQPVEKPSSKYENANNGGNPASATGISYVSASTNTTVNIDGRNVKLDGEKTVSTIEMPGVSSIDKKDDCALNSPAATCYVGQVKTGDKTAELFAFRDASSSSVLMTDTETNEFTVQGSSIAYSTVVKLDGQNMTETVIIAPDQSGLMLISDAATAKTLQNEAGFRVSSASK